MQFFMNPYCWLMRGMVPPEQNCKTGFVISRLMAENKARKMV
jgi:hypothetical protein